MISKLPRIDRYMAYSVMILGSFITSFITFVNIGG